MISNRQRHTYLIIKNLFDKTALSLLNCVLRFRIHKAKLSAKRKSRILTNSDKVSSLKKKNEQKLYFNCLIILNYI